MSKIKTESDFLNELVKEGNLNIDLLFNQYKLYIQMADNISNRRSMANTFYLSANSILVSTAGTLLALNYLLIALYPLIICFFLSIFWCQLILQYKNLNTAKFKVINKIEDYLPVSGYTTEWNILEKGEKKLIYWPLTHIEIFLPILLCGVYPLICLLTILHYFSIL